MLFHGYKGEHLIAIYKGESTICVEIHPEPYSLLVVMIVVHEKVHNEVIHFIALNSQEIR